MYCLSQRTHTAASCRSANAPLRARTLVVRRDSESQDVVTTVVDAPSSTPTTSTPASTPASTRQAPQVRKTQKRQAESTDAVATFMTRRFGLAGGLAWLGFLAVGSLGEQVKTRMEVAEIEEKTKAVSASAQKEVVLPSGVRYTDLVVGGGMVPPKGYLVVIDYVGRANGEVFEDTKARKKPIVFLYGARPFTGGMNLGVEQVLASMKAGGKRRVVVPASMGFGAEGVTLRNGSRIPPDAELEYDLELLRVSIPPS